MVSGEEARGPPEGQFWRGGMYLSFVRPLSTLRKREEDDKKGGKEKGKNLLVDAVFATVADDATLLLQPNHPRNIPITIPQPPKPPRRTQPGTPTPRRGIHLNRLPDPDPAHPIHRRRTLRSRKTIRPPPSSTISRRIQRLLALALIQPIPVIRRRDCTVRTTVPATAAVVVATRVIRRRAAAAAHASPSWTVARASPRTAVAAASVPWTPAATAEGTRWSAASAIAVGTELVPRVGIAHPALWGDDIPVLIPLWWPSVAAVAWHRWRGSVAVFWAAGEGSWN